MVPCIGVKIQDATFYPLFNNNAAITLNEQYADREDLIADLLKNTKEGFKDAFDVFSRLCEEGNAVRKIYGLEPGSTPDWEEALHVYSPADAVLMRRALIDSMVLGNGNEVEDLEDRDLWLEELQKKTNST